MNCPDLSCPDLRDPLPEAKQKKNPIIMLTTGRFWNNGEMMDARQAAARRFSLAIWFCHDGENNGRFRFRSTTGGVSP
jgi:hypothetical protein